MTAEEADRLMKTKSRHAAEARMVRTYAACVGLCVAVWLTAAVQYTLYQQEMMDQMEAIFEALGEKENQQEQAKTAASVDVAAYQCEKVGHPSLWGRRARMYACLVVYA